ncbi:hypothetical protein, partial [Acidiphilium multivorum]|uniref:hypothetical protein n=1 Tax=Acidiphilium multivorum TaxID=62140 RepID=UPI001B8BA43C
KNLQTAPKKPLSSNPLSCRYRIVPGSTVEVGPEAAAVAPAASDAEAEGTADGDADAITALPAFLIDADDPAEPQAIAAE